MIKKISSVCFVISSLGTGGAEKNVVQLANLWAASGIKVHIIVFENIINFNLEANITLWVIQKKGDTFFSKVYHTLILYKNLIEIINSTQSEVIISFLTDVNILTLLARPFLKARLIISERTNIQAQKYKRITKLLRFFLYPLADLLVIQTEKSRKNFLWLNQSKVRVIPNGIDISAYSSIKKNAPLNFVTIGRLHFYKGYDLLILAMSKVAKSKRKAKLYIYGEGPELQNLLSLIKELKLENNVYLKGKPKNIEEWVNAGNIFVLSSLYEGFPNVLLEAMASGKAIVSFDCDYGPSEIIKHNYSGILVPSGDVDSLSKAMTQVIENRNLRLKLKNNAKSSVNQFSLAKVIQKWDEAVLTVIQT